MGKNNNPDNTGNNQGNKGKNNNPDNTGNKKLYKVIAGALIEGHATYHVGNTLELTEERAKQIGNQIELVIEKKK